MSLYKVILVDDDAFIRQLLADKMEKFFPELKLVASCANAREGIRAIQDHQPDIVFLDVEMPCMNGFDMLKEISNINFEVIFITSFGHYAIRAIRYSALDFLMKPLDVDELKAAIARFKEKRKKIADQTLHVENFIHNLAARNPSDYKLAIATTQGTIFIPAQEIMRLEADGSYTKFYLLKGKKMIASRTMKDFAELLDEMQFIRVHKSHVINRRFVKSFSGNHLVMEDDSIVEVSRRKSDEVKNLLKKSA